MRTQKNHRALRRALAASTLIVLALAPACTITPKGPDPVKLLEMYREQALGYYEAGQLPQAEDQIRKGLDLSPQDDQLKLMLGWCRQRRGTRDDLKVAENVFRDLAPRKDYRALLGLAECLERKGVLYTESAKSIESGKVETEAADPKKRVQELNDDAKKFWMEALTHYQGVLALKPTENQAMNGLHRTYALLGMIEDSLEWAEKLLAQADGELEFWKQQLKRTDLRADEEVRLRGRMGDTRELMIATHFAAASLLVKLSRKTEAAGHLDAVVLLAPDTAAAYSRRAQLLFDLGRFEEARANLDDFLRLTDLPFEHADVQRAFQTKVECDKRLAALGGTAK